ncbi:MAG TPA: hypothetical protein VEC08_05695 [Nitrososphaerales archaeon]|nr:hypothetical protein [Nitrososphaerales archaeon]
MMEKPALPDEKAAELFFDLASMDRRRILSELQKENLHLNELGRRLDMTSTETLRQLQRLTEARLLEKMSDGRYKLTQYASLVLDTSSPLDFISQHREFFLTHDATLLPREHRARLGELSGCRLTTSTIETMNSVAGMFKGAEKRIDASVLGFELLLDLSRERLKEGVKVRWLMDASFLDEAKKMLRSIPKFPEMRWTPRILGNVNVTDKSAMLTLRLNDGTMGYNAFVGENDSFLSWASDLFTHEWEKAKPWYP